MADTEQAAEADQAVTPDSPPAPTPVTDSQHASTGVARLALAVSIMALALLTGVVVALYFGWHQLQQVAGEQQRVEERVEGRIDQRMVPLRGSLDALSGDMNGRHEQTSRLIQTLEGGHQDLNRRQQSVDKRLSVLAAIVGRSEQGWSLAEVDYLLRIANQRLLLQRDIDTASVALSSADTRLRELADPAYLEVRKSIAAELEALAAVPVIDRPGLSVQLTNAMEQVDTLKVAGSRYTPPETSPVDGSGEGDASAFTVSDWRELPAMIWQLVSDFFHIRHHDQPVRPMLSPEREYYLRENLRLQLGAARLALLSDDNSQYQAALSTAREWLQLYFSADDPKVGAMIDTLQELAGTDIRPVLPDISASLDLLHRQMKTSEQRPGMPALPGDDTAAEGADEAS